MSMSKYPPMRHERVWTCSWAVWLYNWWGGSQSVLWRIYGIQEGRILGIKLWIVPTTCLRYKLVVRWQHVSNHNIRPPHVSNPYMSALLWTQICVFSTRYSSICKLFKLTFKKCIFKPGPKKLNVIMHKNFSIQWNCCIFESYKKGEIKIFVYIPGASLACVAKLGRVFLSPYCLF